LDEVELKILGKGLNRADTQHASPAWAGLTKTSQQLPTCGEDRFGMLLRKQAGIGQQQLPTAPLKKRLTKTLL
jgi:hypothetical protein